jgi:hypothetical protein
MARHPDEARLAGWTPKYEEWRENAMPQMMKGKAKEAFGSYPWYRTEGEPFAKLAKPLKQARVGLVTTGGYSIEGVQEPFAPGPNFQGETPQVHEIPLDVDREKLRIHHFGYDHRFAKEDLNVNLPLDRLQELAAAGEIGSLKPETQVLMGLAPDVAPLLRETIPALVDRFVSDSVEAALLVPS